MAVSGGGSGGVSGDTSGASPCVGGDIAASPQAHGAGQGAGACVPARAHTGERAGQARVMGAQARAGAGATETTGPPPSPLGPSPSLPSSTVSTLPKGVSTVVGISEDEVPLDLREWEPDPESKYSPEMVAKMRVVLKMLAEGFTHSDAAKAVSMSESGVRRWRQVYEDFHLAAEEARRIAWDKAEEVLKRCAWKAETEPKLLPALIFLLKNNRPGKFVEGWRVDQVVSGRIEHGFELTGKSNDEVLRLARTAGILGMEDDPDKVLELEEGKDFQVKGPTDADRGISDSRETEDRVEVAG